MAVIGQTYMTLAERLKGENNSGEVLDIMEMLQTSDMMLVDAPVEECNNGASHLTSVRTGLPTPTWRKLYQGVQPTKGTMASVQDTTGFMEDWSEVDARLVDRSKNPGKLRLQSARAHLQGMAQEAARTMIYGDASIEPEKFTGLAPRFSSTTAGNGNQVLLGGGSGGTNTSIWFVTWGAETCHLLYPEGSMAGIQREDLGKETKDLTDGSLYRVYRERWQWDLGLSVRDWRGIVRIANIDVTTLTKDASAGTDLLDKMIDAYYRLDNPGAATGKLVIYTSRTIAAFLHKQAMNKTNMNLMLGQEAGRPVVSFLGAPIRRMDALLETETAIS